mmetsp:Transcript_40515/g.85037  ORF Transcript_40515/g.85037 Transcript_40515/m.85037 type:complete len:331 (+) Transcript_40515:6250-7242(+)
MLVVNLAIVPNLPNISCKYFRSHVILDTLQLLANRAKIHGRIDHLQIIRVNLRIHRFQEYRRKGIIAQSIQHRPASTNGLPHFGRPLGTLEQCFLLLVQGRLLVGQLNVGCLALLLQFTPGVTQHGHDLREGRVGMLFAKVRAVDSLVEEVGRTRFARWFGEVSIAVGIVGAGIGWIVGFILESEFSKVFNGHCAWVGDFNNFFDRLCIALLGCCCSINIHGIIILLLLSSLFLLVLFSIILAPFFLFHLFHFFLLLLLPLDQFLIAQLHGDLVIFLGQYPAGLRVRWVEGGVFQILFGTRLDLLYESSIDRLGFGVHRLQVRRSLPFKM